MTPEIFFILLQDGLVVGTVYMVIAIALIMVFTVTRIVFVPFGEFIALGALTLASIEQNRLPPTVWLVLGVALLAAGQTLWRALKYKRRFTAALVFQLGLDVLPAVLVSGLAMWLVPLNPPLMVQALLSVALVAVLGPGLYRLAFGPLRDAPVLHLLIAAMAVHVVLVSLGLYLFGPEGVRTSAFAGTSIVLGGLAVSGQNVVVMSTCLLLLAGMYLLFEHTRLGKSLRATAANRNGARLMGIRVQRTGQTVFLLAGALGAVVGILISPTTAIAYDSGFMFVLKGFVASVIGGLASYPVSALGAVFIGATESFSAFFASAYKEVMVFTLLIPALLWRSLGSHVIEDEE